MNTKTKMMLGLSVLTAGTLAAGATGTFAWFTTNKTAVVSYTSIKAQADTRKLKVTMGALTDASLTTPITNYDEATSAWNDSISLGSTASKTSDISSADGMNFKKPVWISNASNAATVEKVNDVAAKDNLYTQFYVKLENTGSSAINVFLNQLTKITATDSTKSADTELAKWTRAAVVNFGTTQPTAGATTGTLSWLFENSVSEEGSNKTLYVTGMNETSKALETEAVDTDTHVIGEFSTVTSASTTATKGYLTRLAAGSSNYYMISVWMEGTEKENQDKADTGSINVTLGFSGIDA